MNWETDVEFCPDMGDLTIDSMAKMIAKGVFSAESFSCILKARYEQMQKNFTNVGYAYPEWNMKVDNVLCLNAKRTKKDARLSVPKSLVEPDNEFVTDLFEKDDFGHDLPVWIRRKLPATDAEKRPRIMFIAQDPKRVNDPKGSVYLSSPFGLHSKDFRESKNGTPRLEVAFFNALMEGERAEIYVTDRLKFYADSPGYVERNEKIVQQQTDFLGKEVEDYFKPDTIVIFGEMFARHVWPEVFNPKGYKHLKVSGFSELVRNEPWRGEWLGKRCLVFLHPSRQNAQLMRKEDDAIIAYYVEGIKGALRQC